MSATAAQVNRLRLMTAETLGGDYTSDVLAEYIEAHPLIDERGAEPYAWDTSTQPPTPMANASWIPTYDLNAAAADVWTGKAAALVQDFDFSADGANYSRSQAYEHAMNMVVHFRRRRSINTIALRPEPERPELSGRWVVNAPEED